MTEDGLTGVKAVLCLLYIIGMWIVVNIVGYFVHTG